MSERLSDKQVNQSLSESPDWSIVSNLAKKQNSEHNHNFGQYTTENTRDYIKDRFSENLEMLEQLGDTHIANLYKSLMDEFPQLRIVKLYDEDIDDNANFGHASPRGDNGNYLPKIAFNFSHKETYSIENARDFEEKLPSNDDRLGSKYSTKRLAFAIGADWKKCAKNRNLVADETLLHEFGHAYDFIENFLRPQYESIKGSSRGAEALYRASKIERANRREYELQSPDGSFEFLERSSEEWKKSERRLRAMGIENYDEYLYARHQYYRDQPDESYADEFAYKYILRHYDEYFTHERNRNDDRIYVDSEKEIELDRDFAHILGLKQGLGVEIDRLDSDRKSIKHISGFLAFNMYVGKSVYLYENGDPKNPGEKWRICSGISEMTLKPVRDTETGNIKHYVFFKDENGTEYHISRTKKEPEIVLCSPKEMAEELGLKEGDRVQLIEHLGGDAREMSFDKLGKTLTQMVEGRILSVSGSQRGENAIINYQIGNTATGLNYPPKRKWKTWYVDNYEILPLPK